MPDVVTVVKSADRTLDLLELLSRRGRPMSHGEIVDALEVPKSSLSKLLKNLIEREYVTLGPDSRSYELGPSVAKLSSSRAQGQSITGLAGPILKGITEATGESSALSLLRGDEIEVAAETDSPQMLLSHVRVGTRIPLFASSGGKAILAFLPPLNQDDYLDRVELKPLTPFTVQRTNELRRQLREIARSGVALVREELTIGVVSLGVPVLTQEGFPVAALNTALPTVRFDDAMHKRCIEALTHGANRLAKLISR